MKPSRNQGSRISRRTFIEAGSAALALGAGSIARAAALDAERALELAEARRDDLIGLLRALIPIRSRSGESAEAAQALVTDFLRALPYRIEETADRPSLYVDHPEYMPPNPPGDGPFVNVVAYPTDSDASGAMFAHIDTHTVEPGWTTDPYEPVLRDGRLYGLGSADDKGGVAAMLVAASALAAAGEPLPVVMSLHGKGGGSRGSLPIFQRLREADVDLDAVLYVHPAETGRGLEDIKTEVQGVVDLALTVKGWRAPPMEIGSIDSAEWSEGGNALEAAIAALEHLEASAFEDVALNLGSFSGGDRIGSVATDAEARFRLKFSGEHTWRDLLDAGREALRDVEQRLPAKEGGRFELALQTVGYRTNPGRADWNAPASRVLRRSIAEVTGQAPSAYPNHYAGDIRYPIRLLGVPAYGLGSLAGGFYGPNEWVDVDDLVKLTAVCIQTMSGWAAMP